MRDRHTISLASGVESPSTVCYVSLNSESHTIGIDSPLSYMTWDSGCMIFTLRNRGVAYSRQIVRFTNADQFWRAFQTRARGRKETWLVTIGAKDVATMLGLWQRCESGECTLEGEDTYSLRDDGGKVPAGFKGYVVLENPPNIVKFRIPEYKAKVIMIGLENYGIDSYAGLDKEPVHKGCGDRGAIDRERSKSDEAFGNAILIENTFSLYCNLIASAYLGSVKFTAASQAMHSYRHRFMPYDIEVHDNYAVTNLERESLYSGRCECLYMGHVYSSEPLQWMAGRKDGSDRQRHASGKIYRLDVNSLYPSVARIAMLPCRLYSVYANADPEQLYNLLSVKRCIARVLIRTDVPIVPVRVSTKGLAGKRIVDSDYWQDGRKADTGTIWPIGKFWTTLCGPELARVYSLAEVIKVDMIACYDAAPLFAKWVDFFFELMSHYRQAGLKSSAAVAKRIMLSLFGKFAQKNKGWIDEPAVITDEPYSQWWQVSDKTGLPEQWRSFAWQVQRMVECGETNDSFPAITAWIHSLGRMYLWRILSLTGMENVYYYDTDSVWTNQTGYDKLCAENWIGETSLGMLKIEDTYDHVNFLGIKHYECDGRVVYSGIPPCAKIDGSNRATIEKSRSVSNDLWRHRPPQPVMDLHKIRIGGGYKHGHIDPDGSVKPLRVIDPDEPPWSWGKEEKHDD